MQMKLSRCASAVLILICCSLDLVALTASSRLASRQLLEPEVHSLNLCAFLMHQLCHSPRVLRSFCIQGSFIGNEHRRPDERPDQNQIAGSKRSTRTLWFYLRTVHFIISNALAPAHSIIYAATSRHVGTIVIISTLRAYDCCRSSPHSSRSLMCPPTAALGLPPGSLLANIQVCTALTALTWFAPL